MLSDREIAILEFERRWWLDASAKNERIRGEFGVDPVRYFQQLNRLIELQMEGSVG